jgi:hypothetical protein
MVKKSDRAEGLEVRRCDSMNKTQVARLLGYVTGLVNQQLLLQNELSVVKTPFTSRINRSRPCSFERYAKLQEAWSK